MQNKLLIKYKGPIGDINSVEISLIKDDTVKEAIFPNVIEEMKGTGDIVPVLYHHDTISPKSPLIVSLPFAQDIRRKATYLENLPKRLRPTTSFDYLLKNRILIADPCSEAFWLKRPNLRDKFLEIPGIPSGFCDTFDDDKTEDYSAWSEAAASGDFAAFIEALIRFEINYGFDLFVPEVPLVDISATSSPSIVNSFNIAVTKIMNKCNKKLPVLYNLTLNYNVFTNFNNDIMGNIKSYVTEAFQNKENVFHGLYVRIRGIDKIPERKDYKDIKPILLEFISWLGALSKTYQLPVFLVHSGYFGYYALERGVQAFSEPPSGDLGDIKEIRKGVISQPKKERLYGKVLIIDDCKYLTKKELDKYLKDKGRLPRLDGVPVVPSKEQIDNTTTFRDHFSKPRSFATRKEEIKRLWDSMKKKEVDAIEQYISRCNNKTLKKFIGFEINADED